MSAETCRPPGEEGLTVTAGETIIAAVDGSVNLDRQEGRETRVSVTEGQARVLNAGVETLVDSQAALRVNEESGEARREEVAVNPRLPSANALLLTYNESRSVDFAWDQFADWTDPILEVSTDAAFNEEAAPVFRAEGNGSASLELTPSRWFWRLVDSAGGESGPTLLFTVDRERAPQPISPAEGTSIPFRAAVPEVNLQWRQSYFADEYRVEVSRNEDFITVAEENSTVNGTTLVQNLSEGRWFWRATPVYRRARLDEAPRSAGGKFQSGAEARARCAETGISHRRHVLLGSGCADGVDFRWQNDRTFIDYRLEVASDRDFTEIIAVSDGPESNRRLLPAAADDSYFWRVSATAADGLEVPVSPIRSFTVRPITGSVELVDPAPGSTKEVEAYAAHSFLWRSDVPGTARFRLDRVTDAADDTRVRIIESLVNGESFTAPLPGEGSYVWQVQILDAGGRMLVESPEGRFRLRSEFTAPVLSRPRPGSSVDLVGSTTLSLGWDPAPGADAYRVVLRAPDGSTIGQDDRVNGLEKEFSLPAGAGPGDYSVELASIRDNPPAGGSRNSSGAATPSASAILSATRQPFRPPRPTAGSSADWKPCVTVSVCDGPRIPRWDAGPWNWITAGPPASTAPPNHCSNWKDWMRVPTPGLSAPVTVSVRKRRTAQAPIHRRRASRTRPAVVISPAAGENRDMTGADRLVFEWQGAADAEFYDLTLYSEGSEVPILRETGLTDTRYVLRNLRILDVGDYVLVLRARTEYEEVGLSLSSAERRVPFSLSLNISGRTPDILTDELQYAE